MLLPLVFLTAAAFLDEIENDVIDYIPSEKPTFLRKTVDYMFHQRWFTKIGILFVVLLALLSIYFFIAILLFDIACFSMRIYGNKQKKTAVYA